LPKISNLKDGNVMATRKLSAEELQAITRLAKQWGKIVVKQAFGAEGPGLDVDFAQMEEVAYAAAQGLTAGALEAASSQQGQLLGEKQPCPQCGKLCSVAAAERPLRVKGAILQLNEPKCYCPTCRRDFFPSASGVEAGQSRLQPDDDVSAAVCDGGSEVA
jgi:hypothetical protein